MGPKKTSRKGSNPKPAGLTVDWKKDDQGVNASPIEKGYNSGPIPVLKREVM